MKLRNSYFSEMNNYEKNLKNRFKGNFALAGIILIIALIFSIIKDWDSILEWINK